MARIAGQPDPGLIPTEPHIVGPEGLVVCLASSRAVVGRGVRSGLGSPEQDVRAEHCSAAGAKTLALCTQGVRFVECRPAESDGASGPAWAAVAQLPAGVVEEGRNCRYSVYPSTAGQHCF